MPKLPTTSKKQESKKSGDKSPSTSKDSQGAKVSTPTGKKEKAKQPEQPKEKLYPKLEVRVCRGSSALTAETAKELLGWVEEVTNEFGSDFLFRDVHEKKIRCLNNTKNRPFYRSWADTLWQEILRGCYWLNGETLIIGEYGALLSAQHRLIALVLAVQEWKRHPERWPHWTKEPTIETLLVLGIPEDDARVNTLDTGKPRSLDDVIFRSPYFEGLPIKNRREASRICSHAVKHLWHRTGVGGGEDKYAPRRTHAESIKFIARHPRILECARFIMDENGTEGRIRGYGIGCGYAAALLYLMGSSTTERESTDPKNPGYSEVDNPSEELLSWDAWDRACEFWVVLAASMAKEAGAIRSAIAATYPDDEGGGCGTVQERTAVIVKSWGLFYAEESITPAALRLEYLKGEHGKELAELPICGGIDLGKPPV